MSCNKTKVKLDNFEILDCDTTQGKAETKCILNFYIEIKDIPTNEIICNTNEFAKLIKSLGGKFDSKENPTCINFTLTKSAICGKEEYNAKIGERIAKSKCQYAAFKIAHVLFYESLNILEKLHISPLIKIIRSSQEAYKIEYDHLDMLCNIG